MYTLFISRLCGLAFPSLSNMRENPFFITAIDQGSVASPVFSLKLASAYSELYLGGWDSSMFTGSPEFHSIRFRSGFWQVSGARAFVGDFDAGSGFETIIDSGTTLMYGPPYDVQMFYSKVPGSELCDENGFYYVPCDFSQPISFSWGGKKWPIAQSE
jgi:cathepsin D